MAAAARCIKILAYTAAQSNQRKLRSGDEKAEFGKAATANSGMSFNNKKL